MNSYNQNPTQLRAALYHRVSTEEQDPTGARDQLRKAAELRQMTITHQIEETGSGARNDRPGLRKLMNLVAQGKIDAVLVIKLDRFGRSALDLLANIGTLQDAGVRFIAVSQGIDIKADADAMSRLMLTMLAAIAEFERDLIKERTRSGLENARKRGSRLGRPPALNAPSPDLVARLRAKGKSWQEIANDLNCSRSAARRAANKCVKKGPPDDAANTLKSCDQKSKQ